uniref:Uncharacterized protein n=1 Tax=Timema genevievae TaxID=629358 RepID=A0A7R9KAC0_TIMGE|nr:unnamed protein product [Timema genevievae]
MSLVLLHRCARKTVNPESVAAFSSQSSPGSNNVLCPSFFNKNPQNLERLRIAYKCEGYSLEKPGRNFWHNTDRGVTHLRVHPVMPLHYAIRQTECHDGKSNGGILLDPKALTKEDFIQREHHSLLVLERLSRHIRASIVHQSGSAVVTASTAEWALNKFLYR